MKKIILLLSLVVASTSFTFAATGAVTTTSTAQTSDIMYTLTAKPITATGVMVGGDRDSHGCIPSAGYSWSEVHQACEQPWEHIYTNSADFLKAEGTSCEVATDGCNTVGIINGKLGAMTEMYCENIYGKGKTEQWSCKKAKTTATATGSTISTEMPLIGGDRDSHGCIPSAGYSWNEYAKACQRPWEHKTYTNSADFLKAEGASCKAATDGCNAVAIVDGKLGAMTKMYCEDVYGKGKTERWSCTQKLGQLSDNDQNFYTHLKDTLPKAHLAAVDNFMKKYNAKIAKLSQKDATALSQNVLNRVENAIEKIIISNPRDIALPKKANSQYLVLSLIKLEILKLQK